MPRLKPWLQLNAEQQKYLRDNAPILGRNWKSEILDLWTTGRDASNPILRQIRNRIGPSGLLSIKPKDLEGTP